MEVLKIIFIALAGVTAVLLAVYLYYAFPNLLVRMFPGRFTKVDPNHAKIVQRGGEIRRVLIGSNFSMAGDDLKDPRSYDILPRIENKGGTPNKVVIHPQRGGKLDTFITILDTWVFEITGHRVVGANFADLFSANVVRYDLKRPDNLRTTNKGKEEDPSDHVILTPQIYEWKVEKAKTGKEILLNVLNADKVVEVKTRQRLPVDLSGRFTFSVTNVWNLLYGTNFGYFPFVLSMLHAGIRDEVQRLSIDELLSEKGRSDIGEGIKKLNEGGKLKTTKENIESVPGATESEKEVAGQRIPGTAKKYGFVYTQLIIEEITPDKGYEEDLQKQQREILKKQAEISSSQLDVTVASNQLEAQKVRAKGAAAFDEERLGAIARGGKEIQTITRDATLTQGVLVADRYAQGVKEAKNGTIYVNAGGLGPVPTIDLTPRETNEGEEKTSDSTSSKQSQKDEAQKKGPDQRANQVNPDTARSAK